MQLVSTLAIALKGANEWILSWVHRDLWQVLSKKNLAFLREISFVVGCPDFSAVLDLVWGLPMTGWARHCPNLVQRTSTLPEPLEFSLTDVEEHNRKVLASVRSSGCEAGDLLAWTKCEREFETGGLLGPWYSYEEIPFEFPSSPAFCD